VDEDPRNVDAAREVRLYEMRRGKNKSTGPRPSGRPSEKPRSGEQRQSQKPPGENLFGKFFKR
jgi:hypothetical protein